MIADGRLGRALDDLGCAALVVLAEDARDPDLAPWVGPVHLGRALLVVPRGGEPLLGFFSPMERDEAAATGLALLGPADLDLDRPETVAADPGELVGMAAARALAAAGVFAGRVAVAGRGPAGLVWTACRTLERGGWIPVPGDEPARLARKAKRGWQLEAVRHAAAGAGAAMRRVAATLAAAVDPGNGGEPPHLTLGGEPLTSGRLRAEIALALAGHGLDQPRGNIVAAGRDAAVPHTAGRDDRVLRGGEAVVVDLFPRGALFADCTRTFCVGRPPEALAAAHRAVAAALAAARAGAVAGARGWDLQLAVCDRLGAGGYPTQVSDPASECGYVHNLGHGVGFELHEYPSFRKESGAEGLLEEGDVFTLEPGLYDPEGGWGVRLEDLVRLGPEGLEDLIPLPYDLDPRAWPA